MSTDEGAPLIRKLRIESIGEGTTGTIDTTQEERAAIARLLDLVALEHLAFEYRVVPSSRQRLKLTGTLTALLVQTCVVTLDPVPDALEVPVEVEFWPEGAFAALEKTAEKDPGASPLEWPEPIEDGTIDLGKVVYETLSTWLDPYPRKQGVSFDWPEQAAEEPDARQGGPFAALERLKRR